MRPIINYTVGLLSTALTCINWIGDLFRDWVMINLNLSSNICYICFYGRFTGRERTRITLNGKLLIVGGST